MSWLLLFLFLMSIPFKGIRAYAIMTNYQIFDSVQQVQGTGIGVEEGTE